MKGATAGRELAVILEEAARHIVPDDTSRRLFHGRGGAFPGCQDVVVDWHPPLAVVFLYRERPQPWVRALVTGLQERLGAALSCVWVQRRYLPEAPGQALLGTLPEPPFAREAGLAYRLRLGAGRNLGFFPDMAHGRARVRALAAGRRVLNLFAYTCSFSVAALAGGAEQVVNVDMNRGSLAWGRRNHADNGLDLRRASFLAHDVFKSFGKLGRLGPYDLLVLDPPDAQGDSFQPARDWPRLLRRVGDLLDGSGDVLACFGAPRLGADFAAALTARWLPEARLVGRLGPPAQFVESDPSRGLQVLHLRIPG